MLKREICSTIDAENLGAERAQEGADYGISESGLGFDEAGLRLF